MRISEHTWLHLVSPQWGTLNRAQLMYCTAETNRFTYYIANGFPTSTPHCKVAASPGDSAVFAAHRCDLEDWSMDGINLITTGQYCDRIFSDQ